MRFNRRSAVRWGASLALLLPVIALYACEYWRGDGRTFTGFIQYDQPYYMADARKYFDGGFHFLYGNPYSPDPQTPGIYFQFQLLFLGFIYAFTGWDPGIIFVVFGFFAGLVCVRVAMALYEEIAGLRTRAQWVGLVLFLWGGGVLALTGWVYHLIEGSDVHTTLTDLFCFDPAAGWWFLNLGRNLIYPLEAYYHALALGLVLAIMRKNFRGALWLAFFLSLSHPYTGLQFLLIVLVWCGWEIGVQRNRSVPFMFAAMILCLLIFHLAYNLILLNLFPEHRVLFFQWSIAWVERASTAIAADLFVAGFAFYAVRNVKLAGQFFSSPANRLLLIWFLVSFALVHHDLFMEPRQPIHFSRGYTWIPLFLLGVQPLLGLLEKVFSLKNGMVRAAVLACLFLIGFSDNLAWFGLHGGMALSSRLGIGWLGEDGFSLSSSERELYSWLMRRPEPHSELLATPDHNLPVVYLAMTYTDYRAWYSHYVCTPYINRRKQEAAQFFLTGNPSPEWKGRTLFVILSRENDQGVSPLILSLPVAYKNKELEVRVISYP